MARNKSFTGSRQAVGTPTLGKTAYFQLIRKCREANKEVRRYDVSGDRKADKRNADV